MESKKQLKAQLTNEISKRYQGRIKELEESRNALRSKIEIERKQYRDLQHKYLELAEEVQNLKDWNDRLMEFMEMSQEDRIAYIENLKASRQFNSQMINLSRMMSLFRL